ncbi:MULTISPECIES: PadR family transcriptional regulator [Oxalobacteraceae]|uniref:PadR family transcriptional regulator n=1 Tax=Oxalobacteraceae TaxID=75682 RepID=UPI001B3BF014|nr:MULTISPECIES: PadR family transcriptional regulator [Oxalobacteraceae]
MIAIFRDVFLGFVRVHILHHAAKEAIYGVEMMEELKHHGYDISPGTLYPILHAMESAGYLSVQFEVIEGKRRKYYRATKTGVRALQELRKKIRELTEEVLE